MSNLRLSESALRLVEEGHAQILDVQPASLEHGVSSASVSGGIIVAPVVEKERGLIGSMADAAPWVSEDKEFVNDIFSYTLDILSGGHRFVCACARQASGSDGGVLFAKTGSRYSWSLDRVTR